MNVIKIKKIINSNIFMTLVLFSLIFYIQKNVMPLGGGNDDAVFQQGIIDVGLLQWMESFYLTWSGRIFNTTLLALLLNMPLMVWRILNAVMFASLFYLISYLFNIKKFELKLLLFVLFFTLPITMISSSSFWITGSLNYLWPVTLSMLYLIYCKNQFFEVECSKSFYIIAAISTFIGCYNEQIVAINLVIILLVIIFKIYNKKTFNVYELIFLTLFFVNAAILLLAPGNFLRSANELIQWNSSFDMYSIFDKLWFGIYALLHYLLTSFQWIILMLSIIIMIKTRNGWKVRLIAMLPAIYIIFREIIVFANIKWPYSAEIYQLYYYLFDVQYYLPSNYNIMISWIAPILAVLVVIAFLYVITMELNDDLKEALFILLLSMGAMCTVIVMGFTPTLASSGWRIYFVLSILFVAIIVFILNKYNLKWYDYLCIYMFFGYFALQNINIFISSNEFLYMF